MDLPSSVRFLVGVDWATVEHQVCLLTRDGALVGQRRFPHSGEGLSALVDWLLTHAHGEASSVWVAIEVPHGAVVETLLEQGFVVHSINPKQLDRFRDRFTVAGAKDDSRDARVLADSLRTDAQAYRPLRVDEPKVIELREWSRIGDDLQQERTRLCNRLREQLRRYYPQALELTDDLDAGWFAHVWRAVPTPERARRVRESTLASILKSHRVRKLTAAHVLETLRRPPLHVAPGTVEAATAHITLLLDRLAIANQQWHQCQQRLEALCNELAHPAPSDEPSSGQVSEQRDAAVLRSMPGLGRIVLATLLAEASQPLSSRDYQALRSLTGLAPVTRQSGKRHVVSMRYACNARLRRATYHWARVATQRDAASRAHYASLRARGHTHGRALRSVADSLLALTCAALRSHSLYDPSRRTRWTTHSCAASRSSSDPDPTLGAVRSPSSDPSPALDLPAGLPPRQTA